MAVPFTDRPGPIKIYYYQAGGRAQQIRYVLAAGGVTFEDVTARGFPPSAEQKAEWAAIGGNTTTNVPMMVVPSGAGDEVYCQSAAALRVAARKTGLMPTANMELYVVDKMISDADDLRRASYAAMAGFGATADQQADYKQNVLPKHLANMERQLGRSEYYTGHLSVADVTVYDALTTYARSMVPACLGSYPGLTGLVKRIESIPTMAAYRSSDQFTSLNSFYCV